MVTPRAPFLTPSSCATGSVRSRVMGSPSESSRASEQHGVGQRFAASSSRRGPTSKATGNEETGDPLRGERRARAEARLAGGASRRGCRPRPSARERGIEVDGAMHALAFPTGRRQRRRRGARAGRIQARRRSDTGMRVAHLRRRFLGRLAADLDPVSRSLLASSGKSRAARSMVASASRVFPMRG